MIAEQPTRIIVNCDCNREGRWWAIEIPALGGITQAVRLADVESEARDYIAVTLDVAPSTVDVRVIVDDTRHAHRVQERSEQPRPRAKPLRWSANSLRTVSRPAISPLSRG